MLLVKGGEMARKAEHGGKRPGAGRKKTSERDDVAVKVDRQVVAKLRYVAEIRDITLAELLTDLLRPLADREFLRTQGRPPAPEGSK